MPTLFFIASFLPALLAHQAPPPAPACYLLTMEEVATIIGTTRPRAVTNTGTGSTCMFVNRDKTITLFMVKLSSVDAAKDQWETRKRAAAGQDVAGWPTPAYVGAMNAAKDHAAIVGIYSSLTFVEVKAVDAKRETADLSAQLQTIVKALSGRLAAQR